MTFKYEPQWQGPLSGRSFEKQTEDIINQILATDPANASDSTPLAPSQNGSAGSSDEWSRSDHQHPRQNDITGNAATATRLQEQITLSLSGDATGQATFDGSQSVAIPTTIPTATTSAKGLMSAADKVKLNGIANNANNYTLPVATSSRLGGVFVDAALADSPNPVQNSVVEAALAGKEPKLVFSSTSVHTETLAANATASAAVPYTITLDAAYQRLVVIAQFPITDSAKAVACSALLEDGLTSQGINASGITSTTASAGATWQFDTTGGIFSATLHKNTATATGSNLIGPGHEVFIAEGAKMQTITFSLTGGMIPAGTEITVYAAA